MDEKTIHTDPELLVLIAQGDEAAFEGLLRGWQGKIFGYINRITQSRELALDLTQDIFLTLWQRREKLTGIENFNAYIHQMARSGVYHAQQRIAKEELVLHVLKTGAAAASSEDAGLGLISKEVRQHIREAIDRLQPRQREAFLLSREEGLSYQEIADRMGIGYETVKYHIAEALKTLRSTLREHYGPEAFVIILIWQLGHF